VIALQRPILSSERAPYMRKKKSNYYYYCNCNWVITRWQWYNMGSLTSHNPIGFHGLLLGYICILALSTPMEKDNYSTCLFFQHFTFFDINSTKALFFDVTEFRVAFTRIFRVTLLMKQILSQAIIIISRRQTNSSHVAELKLIVPEWSRRWLMFECCTAFQGLRGRELAVLFDNWKWFLSIQTFPNVSTERF
jgi:hypothetical protein